jgi:hypothetical protein
MKRFVKYLLATVIVVILGWCILTIYVEKQGPSRHWSFGDTQGKKVLIVFDPDPFYNLDEQVCLSFGKAFAEQNMSVTIVTVAASDSLEKTNYALLIYCANTYNWRPDWSICSFIEENESLTKNIPVVAITLGAGSTGASQKHFERQIVNAGGKILESYSLWLWRPNDEQKMKEPNVDVAVAMSYDWGKQVANKLN